MEDVDYKSWAEYLLTIYEDYFDNIGSSLELGGGNCLLAKELKKSGLEIITSDLSLPMLRQNECKGLKNICCDMTRLPFNSKFNFIFSAFDSINYLLTEKELSKLFNEVERILSKDGIFTFDVSLENNSLYNLEHLNRKGNISGFEYVQTSKYSESERIHTNEFEISVGDEIFKEVHKQKIYSFETYFDVIEKSPLFVSECFNAFTFEDASADSLRAQFILKKR